MGFGIKDMLLEVLMQTRFTGTPKPNEKTGT
jgi:hypothetical protein